MPERGQAQSSYINPHQRKMMKKKQYDGLYCTMCKLVKIHLNVLLCLFHGRYISAASGRTGTRAGLWHRRNRQMLGAPPIHRGAKMSEDFFFITNSLKCSTKSGRPTKTTILLLSSVRLMIFLTAALPHTSVT